MRNFAFLLTLIFVACHGYGAEWTQGVSGNDAKLLYLVAAATDGSDDEKSEVQLAGDCLFGKNASGYFLQTCNYEEGYINSPVKEILSAVMLANRRPKPVDDESYLIGVYYHCSKTLTHYQCTLMDPEDDPRRHLSY